MSKRPRRKRATQGGDEQEGAIEIVIDVPTLLRKVAGAAVMLILLYWAVIALYGAAAGRGWLYSLFMLASAASFVAAAALTVRVLVIGGGREGRAGGPERSLLPAKVRGYLRENWGAPFVLAFMFLLIVAAVFLASGSEALANEVAVYAYYSLVAGVLLQLAAYVRYERRRAQPRRRRARVEWLSDEELATILELNSLRNKVYHGADMARVVPRVRATVEKILALVK